MYEVVDPAQISPSTKIGLIHSFILVLVLKMEFYASRSIFCASIAVNKDVLTPGNR